MEQNYKIRRSKNNDAVKKSREKSRNQAQKMVEQLESLRDYNSDLSTKITNISAEIACMKKTFIKFAGGNNSKSLTREQIDYLCKDNEECSGTDIRRLFGPEFMD